VQPLAGTGLMNNLANSLNASNLFGGSS